MAEKDAETARVIELQRILTAIPALNPEAGGDGEGEKAAALKRYLKRIGFKQFSSYDVPDSRVPELFRPNFSVTIKGRTKKPALWVMMHLDVVPPGERLEDGSWKGWDSDPFCLSVKGDLLYGRGVEDNHQAIAASLIAARRIMESGSFPENDVVLLFVSGEETGSHYGLKKILEDHKQIFDSGDFFLVPDGGNEEGTLIEVSEKSVLWLTFHVKGSQTHGSTPNLGNNAFRSMAEMVSELDRRLHAKFDRRDRIFRPSYSTFEPTRHGNNVPNINTVPGDESFSFDCRVLPSYCLDDVLDAARQVVASVDAKHGTYTEFKIENRLDAPAPTPSDSPIVKALSNALKATRNVEGEALGLGGSTVAAFFRKAGLHAVVWSTIKGVAHQVNEHALISNILADADVYECLFKGGVAKWQAG